MLRTTSVRSAVVAVVAGLALAGASVANATVSTGSQNPDLTAAVSMTSSGSNPDVARPGDRVTIRLSVTNNTATTQFCHVYLVADVPWAAGLNVDGIIKLAPGRTWLGFPVTVPVFRFFPAGAYTVSLYALGTSAIDPSVASATITLAT